MKRTVFINEDINVTKLAQRQLFFRCGPNSTIICSINEHFHRESKEDVSGGCTNLTRPLWTVRAQNCFEPSFHEKPIALQWNTREWILLHWGLRLQDWGATSYSEAQSVKLEKAELLWSSGREADAEGWGTVDATRSPPQPVPEWF